MGVCSCFVLSDPLDTVTEDFAHGTLIRSASSPGRRRCPPRRRRDFVGTGVAHERRRGRGTLSNVSGRYEPLARIAFDDGWQSLEELPAFQTTVTNDATRKIITRNKSPDISFDRSINPYRGCEHGCVYCFARPTHAYLGLSPGLDFETKLFAKPDAPELLEKELSAPNYEPRTIAIGTNTDPYQPIERSTRSCAASLKCWSGPATRSASSPSRRWSCATSTSCADGRAQPGQGRAVGDDARSETRSHDGAARRDAGAPPRGAAATFRRRRADLGDGGAGHPGDQRHRDRAHPRSRGCRRRQRSGYVLLRLPLEVRDLFMEWLKANIPTTLNT